MSNIGGILVGVVGVVGIVATSIVEKSGKATSGSASLSYGDKKLDIKSDGSNKSIGGH